ncbi:MAG: family 10 glycosylhydrolase, partial [Pseudanabaena sp.]
MRLKPPMKLVQNFISKICHEYSFGNALWRPILWQIWRSRKYFLTFLFIIAFVTTLILPSLIPALATTHQAIAQIKKPNLPNSAPMLPRQEIRGVWLTSNDFTMFSDRKQLSQALQQLKRLNFNTIYPVVWASGYVMFPSTVAQNTGIQPFVYRGAEGQDIVADIIKQAHQHNLLVMPWFEFGFMAPLTSELATNHPDWLTQERDGDNTSITAAGQVAWLNPFHPEVQKFMTELVLEAVSNYDLDGIQFDDHTSLPKTFGYDRYTLNLYRQETKREAPANPDNPDWVRWRANKITAFMTNLNKAVKQRKPNLIFSVSPNYY